MAEGPRTERAADRAADRASGLAGRVRRAWRALAGEQRMAALAALGLLGSMFLPWYEKNTIPPGKSAFVSDSVSAFGVVSFVEAAILLVALGVLVMLFARAERRPFHLPGGDGTVVLAAGGWAALLLFYRVFDRPDVSGSGSTVGIQWGFFIAFVAAGALAFAGARVRAAGRPEPPLPEEVPTATGPAPDRPTPRRRATDRRRESEARTVALPGEVPEPMDPPPAPDRLF